jgi:hypothetical protein
LVWLYAALLLVDYQARGWDVASRKAKWQRRRRWTARDLAMAVQQELWGQGGAAFPPVWMAIRGHPPEIPFTIWPMGLPATAASRL